MEGGAKEAAPTNGSAVLIQEVSYYKDEGRPAGRKGTGKEVGQQGRRLVNPKRTILVA